MVSDAGTVIYDLNDVT